MLYRVIGPMGSGKTKYLQGLVKEAFDRGERVFVIVPEQATAGYERDLVTLCGNRVSSLVEVTNFSRLSNIVLRSFGSLSGRSVTEEEKKLILAHLMEKKGSALSYFPQKSDPDTVQALLEEMEEVRLAGLDAPAIEALTERGGLDQTLTHKLGEIHTLRTWFRQEVEKRFSDPMEEEERLAGILAEFPFFRDCTVILDRFWDFTSPQEKLIRQILCQAKTVAVSFVARKKEPSTFSGPLLSARRILKMAQEIHCRVEDVTLSCPEDGGALSFLREHITLGEKPFCGEPDGISITPCLTEADQASFVAQTCRDLVKKGAAWRDIAIFYRGKPSEIFTLTLEEEGIPVFLDEKKPLSTSPLARTVLLAVQIATGYPTQDQIREYLHYGVFSCPDGERFYLEKYIATWSLSGRSILDGKDFVMNPDGYLPTLSPSQKEELDLVNRAKKRIFTPLRGLSFALAEGTNEEKISALVSFLVQIGAEKESSEAVSEYKKLGLWEKAGEEVRNWNTVLERLSGIARTLGGEKGDAEGFLNLLTLSLSGSLPGSLPPGQDRVQMGEVGFSRPYRAKHIFLISLSAGIFPAEAPKGRFFSDRERQTLWDLGYPLSYGEKAGDQEIFLFYLATAFARENLFLTYTCASGGEDGKKGALSVFGKRVQALFPSLKVKKEPYQRDLLPPSTKESAFRYLIAHAGEDTPLVRALSDYFLEDDAFHDRVLSALSGKAYGKGGYALVEEKPYGDSDISMTYSRLEKYSYCRFSYFARYLLEAKKATPATFGANITGSFVHEVLEKVLSGLAAKGKTLSDLTPEELKEENRLACQEAVRRFAGEEIPGSLAMQLKQIQRSTLLILKQLQEEFSVSLFQPLYFEKELTDLGGAFEIPLKDGKKLRLFGTIDRVDLYRGKGGQDYIRVVDYKTGGHEFNLNHVANGLDLQMLLYLFALWGRPMTEGAGPAMPASILYLNGMDQIKNCQTRSDLETVEEKPYLSLGREGLLVEDAELLSAQDPDGRGAFIPFAWNSKRKAGKGNLITLEKLGLLKQKVERDFARMAEEIKDGRIEENPLFSAKRKIDPCAWCEHLPICKRSSSSYRPYREGLTEDEIFGKGGNM